MINNDTVWLVTLRGYYYEYDVTIDDYETHAETKIVGIFPSESEAKYVKKKLDKVYTDDDIHETICTEWPIGRIIDEEILQDISDFEKYGVI